MFTNKFITVTSVEAADGGKETLLNAALCVCSPSAYSARVPRAQRAREGGEDDDSRGRGAWGWVHPGPIQQTAAPEPSRFLCSESPRMHTDIKAWKI